jgi:mono/diheme cytochrome c family protein
MRQPIRREISMLTTTFVRTRVLTAALALPVLAILAAPAKADNTAEATYKAKCAMCHGADGKGETPTGKSLKVKDFASDEVQKQTDADLGAAISGGKGKMPAYKTLTPDQVKDLTAYVRAFAKKK